MTRRKRVVGLVVGVGVVAAGGVALAASTVPDGSPTPEAVPSALQRSLQTLDAPNRPAGELPSSGVQVPSEAGLVRAWSYTTQSGEPGVAVDLAGVQVVGGCESTTDVIAKCLSQYQGSELLVIGQASGKVQRVVFTTVDGTTTEVNVVNGLWAAAVPTGGQVAPTALVGVAADGSQLGVADGKRIVATLAQEAEIPTPTPGR